MNRWLKRTELRLKNSSFFAFRNAASRVFYPGCSLPGNDPDFCLEVYLELKKTDPELGLWFDCCAMPLRMGRDRAQAARAEESLLNQMLAEGVEEVVTACGNCYQQFTDFSEGKLRVRLLYDLLAGERLTEPGAARTIHHPCFARRNPALQLGALRLSDELGLRLKNKEAEGHPLACCLHTNPVARERRKALQGEELLTYCAHCVVSFQEDIPTRHLLQELFGSKTIWRPRGKYGLFANYRRFCRLASRLV